jgi:type I restriction enzyme S subunit
MELKPGYKQTEVGVIPEDWEVHTMNQLFLFRQGVQSPVVQQEYVEQFGYKRFIRIIDLTDSSVPWRFIVDPGPSHHVLPSDLFMVRYGTPGLVGLGYNGVIANNLFQLIPKKSVVPTYYFHYLLYRRADIADISGSTTMPAISFSTLGVFKIIYPPLAEQQAIAKVLSDMDAELEALESLIAKKRDIKQATMQELLTGRTRLV